MNDETEMAKGKGKGAHKGAGIGGDKGKKPGGADGKPKIDGHISRLLVRAIWGQEWALANPDANLEDRKAAWLLAKDATLEKNLKLYRRAMNTLSRAGVTFGLTEVAARAAPSAQDDDGGED